jgi:L-ascorbate metabolism protein UlaG (beta-lactamase superfamily)
MQIQLIRNATMRINYANHTILTDPALAPKGTVEPFAGIARNPTVELPFNRDKVVDGVEMVLVSHTHMDHIDRDAAQALPQEIPLFCQPGDESILKEMGFNNTVSIESKFTWEGIRLIRTSGVHGQGKILKHMGQVSGYALQADGEPSVYWVGDSILCQEVKKSISDLKPDIIIIHSGGATIPNFDPIIMDADQTLDLFGMVSKEVVVVAIHLEALDHCTVSRAALRELANSKGIEEKRLLIPDDGEIVSF